MRGPAHILNPLLQGANVRLHLFQLRFLLRDVLLQRKQLRPLLLGQALPCALLRGPLRPDEINNGGDGHRRYDGEDSTSIPRHFLAASIFALANVAPTFPAKYSPATAPMSSQ